MVPVPGSRAAVPGWHLLPAHRREGTDLAEHGPATPGNEAGGLTKSAPCRRGTGGRVPLELRGRALRERADAGVRGPSGESERSCRVCRREYARSSKTGDSATASIGVMSMEHGTLRPCFQTFYKELQVKEAPFEPSAGDPRGNPECSRVHQTGGSGRTEPC